MFPAAVICEWTALRIKVVIAAPDVAVQGG